MDRRRRLSLRLLVGCLAVSGSACMGDAGARREVVVLRRQVDQLRAKSIRDLRTIRELENRVFVLEDRLETEQVQGGKRDRPPRLPVVTRRPVEPPPVAGPAAPVVEPVPPTATAVASAPAPAVPLAGDGEVEIVYEGDALVSSARVSLNDLHRSADGARIGEVPSRRARRGRAVETLPDPAAVTDRIAVVPIPGARASRAAAPTEDPAAAGAYKDAYAALQRREHAAAIAAFQKFLERWPAHGYADNAQYWLGEARYDQRDYKQALGEFRKVIQKYPGGNKAPDALLKIGFCYANLADAGSARDVLSQVVDIYPRTDAARLAQKRLEELKLR